MKYFILAIVSILVFSSAVHAAAPNTPTNSAPANAATNVGRNPTFIASVFADLDGDAHQASRWQLRKATGAYGDADFHDSGPSADLTSHILWDGLVDGWLYKKPISLIPATPMADYPLKIELSAANFDYGKAKTDGADIRFYNTNGIELNYWIETWDTGGTSSVWVKIPAADTDTIYLFYGNSSASSASSYFPVTTIVDPGFEDTFDFTGVWAKKQPDYPGYDNGFTVAVATSGGDPGHFISINGDPASYLGHVFIAQEVTVPHGLTDAGFNLSYQTYCSSTNRGGGAGVMVVTKEVWDTLPSVISYGDIAKLWDNGLHGITEADATTWTTESTTDSAGLIAALTPYEGEQVVFVAYMLGVHVAAVEWGRLDNFEFSYTSPSKPAVSVGDEMVEVIFPLAYDGTYFWQVQYQDDTGAWSAWSDETGFTTENDLPPATPSNLLATIAATCAIDLIWTDNSTDETGFRIERKEGAAGIWNQIGTVAANVAAYQDSGGLNINTTYYYRVFADKSGLDLDSVASNENEATTSANTYYQDNDGDGFGNLAVSQQACVAPEGYMIVGADCNDDSATVYPGAWEFCNGVDDDCNSAIDDNCGAPPSETPVNSSPANATTDVNRSPTLSASIFSDSGGDTHQASQWQISTASDVDFAANMVYDSGPVTDLEGHNVAASLNGSATYYWRVRYLNSQGLWSSYSGPTTFTVVAAGRDYDMEVCASGCLYSLIQDAINAAVDGDIIGVHSGTYNENILIQKQITLRAMGEVSIVGDNNGGVVRFDEPGANGAVLDGFHITTVTNGPRGIQVGKDGSVVQPSIINCLITGFSAVGIFADYDSLANIINCTISGNNEGIHSQKGAHPKIFNSILWGNAANQIFVSSNRPGWEGRLSISNSLLQGGCTNTGDLSPDECLDIIDADPQFTGGNDYHLQPSSPAIDSGVSSAYGVAAPLNDMVGLSRPVDGPDLDNDAGYDLGIYEYGSIGIYYDQTAPLRPENISPAAPENVNIPLAPTLMASPFVDLDSDSHSGSRWQVRKAGGAYGDAASYDSGITFSDLNSHTIGLVPPPVFPQEAAAFWNFEEGSGNIAFDNAGHNDLPVNGAQWSSAGKHGKALYFDGTDDYLVLGNLLPLRNNGDQTIEMWIKPLNFDVRRSLLAKTYGGQGAIYLETNGTLSYLYGICGGNCYPYQLINTNFSLTANEWSHLVLVRDLSGMQLKWYVNGSMVSEVNALFPAAVVSTIPAYLGQGDESDFIGSIDEMVIYNRVLTENEIMKRFLAETVSAFSLSANTDYYWRVQYRDETGDWSAWSGETGFSTESSGSLNLTATASSTCRIDLSWDDNSNDETGFRVERKDGEGGTWSPIGTTLSDQTTYPDSIDLNPATTYSYRVVAFNDNGDFAPSNVAEAVLLSVTYYQDVDNDGYGNPAVSVESCTGLNGYVTDHSDCDDTDAALTPATVWYKDSDGDGYSDGATLVQCLKPATDYFLASTLTAVSGDCDDSNPAVNPALVWFKDTDGDGYSDGATLTQCDDPGLPYHLVADLTAVNGDCDDSNNALNPGVPEACDEVDNNCDGRIDEGLSLDYTYYRDADGDGHGSPDIFIQSCVSPAPAGYVNNSNDCDDTRIAVNPDMTENCNGIDDDCNGIIDDACAAGTRPEIPENISPANGITGVLASPLLSASAFFDSDGDNHQASQWQISSASGGEFATGMVYDSDPVSELTSYLVTATLDGLTSFYWRVRYLDSQGLWSLYSVPTAFTVVADQGDYDIEVCVSGCPYSVIQDALNAATNGEIIGVHPGTYNENISIQKQITLRAMGEVSIVGDNDWGVVRFDEPSASGAVLDGFHITTTNNGSRGIQVGKDGSIVQPSIINCLITGFSAVGIFTDYDSRANIINCTITGNNEGIRSQKGAHPKIFNSILWTNTVNQIFVSNNRPGWEGQLSISNSLIQGGCANTGDRSPNQCSDIINADPQFAGGSDYHLQLSSPAIDSGVSLAYGVAAPLRDIVGLKRPVDGPDPDNDAGYDLGAYEYGSFIYDGIAPLPPENVSPVAPENVNIPLAPTLMASPFADPDNDSHNGSRWQVRRADGAYGDADSYQAVTEAEVSHTIVAPLVSGSDYYWQVQYQDDTGAWSAWSRETLFTTWDNAPPLNLTATAIDSMAIRLEWTDDSDAESGFEIARQVHGEWQTISTVAINTATFTDRTVQPETECRYRIRAFRNSDQSLYSNEVLITTPAWQQGDGNCE